jgi:hypothetical protein
MLAAYCFAPELVANFFGEPLVIAVRERLALTEQLVIVAGKVAIADY